jgi:hypothetical protein
VFRISDFFGGEEIWEYFHIHSEVSWEWNLCLK